MSNLELFKSFVPKDEKVRVKGNSAVIYTRVSHSSQEDNTSLESQLKYCESFAKRKGLNIVGYFGGTYESAKTDDRKEFKRMLKFIKQSRNVSHVVVYSYERFSRSGVGGAKIAEDLLREYGVATLAVTQELDPTTVSGSFQQKIFFLFSQMDNELRRDKTVTGMSELLRKGYTPYSIPRGYMNLNKGGKCVDQQIVPNDEGELIRKAFYWKVKQNMSNMTIVRKLRTLGMDIDKRRLGEIFANPYYCGIIVSKMIPDEIIEGKHEPIVSRKMFLEANKIIAEKRQHPTVHKDIDENLPLKRFVLCGECNTPLTGFLVKKKGLYYYKCRTQGCNHNLSAKKLHEDFSAILSMFQVDVEDIELVEGLIMEYFSAYFEEQSQNLQLSQKKLTELYDQLTTVKERYALGKIDDEMYAEFSGKYKKQIDEIENNIDPTAINSSNLKNCLKYVLEFCSNPLSLWQSRDIERKIQLQKYLFPEGISISKQKREVLTSRINSLFAPIVDIARELRENKKGQSVISNQLSFRVTSTGFKLSVFIA